MKPNVLILFDLALHNPTYILLFRRPPQRAPPSRLRGSSIIFRRWPDNYGLLPNKKNIGHGGGLKMSDYCFVYTSVARRKLSEEQLKILLKKSRQKNLSRNISGMLLYLDPFFIQILEGEEPAVDALYSAIRQDPRHHKVSLIYKKPIQKRSFADWSMGFNVVKPESVAGIEGFSGFFANPTGNSLYIPGEIDRLLKMFKDETLF